MWGWGWHVKHVPWNFFAGIVYEVCGTEWNGEATQLSTGKGIRPAVTYLLTD